MERLPRRIAALLTSALIAVACAGGASPSPSAPPTPTLSPQPSGDGANALLLRATLVQALPPLTTFGRLPVLLVTADRHVLLQGAVPAIYPGPLLAPILRYSLSAAGWAALVDEARTQGLLTGAIDFTGGTMAPGAQAGRLEIVVDGKVYDMTGDPSRIVRCGQARCIPTPGTPEAFAAFWSRFADIVGWMGAALTSDGTYVPEGYAIVTGPPPALDPQLSGVAAVWPLATPLSTFGKATVGDPSRSCGVVRGADATTLRPLLEAATQLTRWRDATAPAVLYGLTVRPLLPGDGDLCAPLVGG